MRRTLFPQESPVPCSWLRLIWLDIFICSFPSRPDYAYVRGKPVKQMFEFIAPVKQWQVWSLVLTVCSPLFIFGLYRLSYFMRERAQRRSMATRLHEMQEATSDLRKYLLPDDTQSGGRGANLLAGIVKNAIEQAEQERQGDHTLDKRSDMWV